MSIGKSLKLYDSLTLSEKRDFEVVMNSVNRESLQKLYKCVQKNRSKLENKEALFKELFGERYTPKKDYLLRNEQRLFTDRIKHFLIQRQSEEEIKENTSYANYFLQASLLKHKLYREYEAEFNKSYAKAIEGLNYAVAQKMLNQYFNYLMTQPKISLDKIEEAYKVLGENLENIKYRYRTDVSINQQGRVAMEAVLKAFGKQVEPSSIGADKNIEEYKNPFIMFFEFSALANQAEGEEKLKYSKLAEESIGQVEEIYPKNRVDGLAMLAGAYFTNREYKEAVKFYKKAFEFKDKKKLPIRNDILFNYVSTLMKLNEYESAIENIETYSNSIKANPKVRHKFDYFQCMAHIFVGNHKEVRKIIPQNIGGLPEDEHHFFRFIYCILPYLDGDIEGATREVINFIAYFNHHGDALAFPQEKGLAQIFKNFFSVLMDMPNKSRERNKMLIGTMSDMENTLEQYPQYTDYLYVKWLKGEIEKKMQ